MTPEEFLHGLEKHAPAPVYLFLGPEAYMRERSRRALIAKALPGEDRETGFTRIDLDNVPLAAGLDDARSLTLFATARLIWMSNAEAALPRGRIAAAEDDDSDAPAKGDAALIGQYLRDPAPGVVVVIEASRYGFDGDDRAKMERVQKFFSAIQARVEFRPFAMDAARALAQRLARENELKIGLTEIGLLVEATGGDASRIANEIEKLSLFGGKERKVTAEDLARLVPDAQATTMFELVRALGRNDRTQALEILDMLVREGEYLPLALSFLATQFRMALSAREANLRSAQQIQAHFTRAGIRIWRDRAEQVYQTVSAFSKVQLENALTRIFHADRGLRDARPDDRVVMENLILGLTTQ